jgi:hypothetical protein
MAEKNNANRGPTNGGHGTGIAESIEGREELNHAGIPIIDLIACGSNN